MQSFNVFNLSIAFIDPDGPENSSSVIIFSTLLSFGSMLFFIKILLNSDNSNPSNTYSFIDFFSLLVSVSTNGLYWSKLIGGYALLYFLKGDGSVVLENSFLLVKKYLKHCIFVNH